MDRDRYIELLRQNHRVSKMRTDLFLADQNDDDTDMEKSKATCEGINAKHRFILTEADVGGYRAKLEAERQLNHMGKDEENKIDSSSKDNIEYKAWI